MKSAIEKSFIFVFFLISLCVLAHSRSTLPSPQKPCKRLTLYYHDTMFTGPNAANATAATIANPDGTGLGNFKFGKISDFSFKELFKITNRDHLSWSKFFYFTRKSRM